MLLDHPHQNSLPQVGRAAQEAQEVHKDCKVGKDKAWVGKVQDIEKVADMSYALEEEGT